MNQKMLELLYRSFDAELSTEEQQQLEQALASSKQLTREKEELTRLRTIVSDEAAQSFKPFFAARVMRRIRSVPERAKNGDLFFESLITFFKPVAIAAMILLLVLFSYNMGKSKNFTLAGAFAEPEITLEEVLDPLVTLTTME
jgi:hypothetical protein